MSLFTRDSFAASGGLPHATQGPETETGALVGAGFEREAIERNYWYMRQGRAAEIRAQRLSEISTAINGPDSEWRRSDDDVTQLEPGQMMRAEDYSDIATREAEDLQKLFDDLALARQFEPGQLANFPGTLAELEEQAAQEAGRQLRDELDSVNATISNRSQPSFAGGVAEFVGMAGAAVSDIEGVALLPLGGPAAGTGVSLGRMMLIEGALGALGEAATIPAYRDQAQALDIPEQNYALNVALGGVLGAALPLAGRAGRMALNTTTRAGRASNRELLGRARRADATDVERGAGNAVGRDVATTDTSGRLDENGGVHRDRADQAEASLIADEPVNVVPQDIAAPAVRRGAQSGMTRQILDLIVRADGGPEGYDAVFNGSPIEPPRPVTQMTIDDVLAFQDQMVAAGSESSAVGGPQFIRGTLRGLVEKMGLSGRERFDASMQDRLAIELMREKGLDDFLAGDLDVGSFGDGLSDVWAALPRLTGAGRGEGTYDAVGSNNNTIDAETLEAVLSGDAPRLRPLGQDARAADVYDFDPADLIVDADAYQFKLDGDGRGVTSRLQSERVWDPTAAIGVIVHERIDGSRYIADGHQRHALATRMAEQGQQDIRLQGMLLREADGYTVEEVRAIAALRNIRQESGTPLDAALIIRDFPELARDLSRGRDFMQQADGLSQLAPGPFQAVRNEVIPQNQAALVGRYMPGDEELQQVAIATLAKAEAPNVFQAESIVREIRRLGLEARDDAAQGSLFDGFDLGETIIRERARVLDAVQKDLRKDRTVFSRLSDEADRIEEEGNALDRTANAGRQARAEAALRQLILLADEPGPVRDALDAAARDLKSGAKLGDVVRDVAEAVGRAGDEGAAGRGARGGDYAGAEGAALKPDTAEQAPVNLSGGPRDADLFGDPAEGRGVIAQIAADEAELRALLDAEPDLFGAAGPTDGTSKDPTTVRAVLAELEDEADFIETLGTICSLKGN